LRDSTARPSDRGAVELRADAGQEDGWASPHGERMGLTRGWAAARRICWGTGATARCATCWGPTSTKVGGAALMRSLPGGGGCGRIAEVGFQPTLHYVDVARDLTITSLVRELRAAAWSSDIPWLTANTGSG
jgi:hypothetical protein